MGIHNFKGKMNIIVILVCLVIAAAAAATAVWFASERKYETISAGVSENNSDKQQSVSYNAGKELTESGNGHLSEDGISVTLNCEVPKNFDVLKYIKQGYELKNFAAVDSFSSADGIPLNPAVQYAFCYIYSGGKCLVDIKNESMTYRQADEAEIQQQLEKIFGSFTKDIKKSNLYSSGKGYFEMWQPDYSADVYASATLSSTGDEFKLEAVYYKDESKKTMYDQAVITVKKGKEGFYISSLS